MPKISNISGPYRFYFVSADCQEPPHVHVVRDRQEAKFWLTPVRLFSSQGFPGHELRKIKRIIEQHHTLIMETWHEHC